jgi:hypothetical protein
MMQGKVVRLARGAWWRGEGSVTTRRGKTRRSRERECRCSAGGVARVSVRGVECGLKEKNLEAVRVALLHEYDYPRERL